MQHSVHPMLITSNAGGNFCCIDAAEVCRCIYSGKYAWSRRLRVCLLKWSNYYLIEGQLEPPLTSSAIIAQSGHERSCLLYYLGCRINKVDWIRNAKFRHVHLSGSIAYMHLANINNLSNHITVSTSRVLQKSV